MTYIGKTVKFHLLGIEEGKIVKARKIYDDKRKKHFHEVWIACNPLKSDGLAATIGIRADVKDMERIRNGEQDVVL